MNNRNDGPLTMMLGVLVGAVAAVFALTWAAFGMASWMACGTWEALRFTDRLKALAAGVDPSGLAGYECLPGAGLTRTVGIVVLFSIIAAGVAAFMAWRNYQQSDWKFMREVRQREGIAQGREVRNKAGRNALMKRAASIRPTVDKPEPADVGRMLGVSQHEQVWMSMEDSVVLLGPPRSGKGFYIVINAILDSPGAVITTSTRGDNVAATLAGREKIGPCTVFDPQGLSGVKSSLKWSPFHGCESSEVAAKRAQTLIAASGLGKSSNNQEWAQQAEIILGYLLHAAALGKVAVAEFARWGQSPALAERAVEILERSKDATPGWAQNLKAEVTSDARTRSNKWMGVIGATAALNIPGVAEALDPREGEESLDPAKFIREKGTLYLLGSKSGGGAIAPFLIALMDEIVETGREMAFRMPGNRLDPPMSLVLDEIANLAPWNSLPTIMADGGGVGISTLAVFQSPAQARGQWGEQEAQALLDSAILQVQLGGSNNDAELRKFTELMGQREVRQKSKSWSESGTNHSEQRVEKAVMHHSELRRLPVGYGLLLNRNARPILMKMVRWIDRKDAAEIKASQSRFAGMMDRGTMQDEEPVAATQETETTQEIPAVTAADADASTEKAMTEATSETAKTRDTKDSATTSTESQPTERERWGRKRSTAQEPQLERVDAKK